MRKTLVAKVAHNENNGLVRFLNAKQTRKMDGKIGLQ